MALWHYGIMALWHYGIMALWHYGTNITLHIILSLNYLFCNKYLANLTVIY